jgi:hypothetical protein
MATRGPLSRGKRERERARVEVRRNQTGSRPGGEDPDIAGIVPGPQANPWGDEPDAEAGEGEESDEP